MATTWWQKLLQPAKPTTKTATKTTAPGAQVNMWAGVTPGYNTLQKQTTNAYQYQQQVPMAKYKTSAEEEEAKKKAQSVLEKAQPLLAAASNYNAGRTSNRTAAAGQNKPAESWWQKYQHPTTPDTYNAGPAPEPIPTGSFLAANGQMALGPGMKPTPVQPGPTSFIGGGGSWVRGPNGLGYYIGTPGPNSFIGAGGEAVRGPVLTVANLPAPTADVGATGFGTSYDWWKRRSSGGYGGSSGGGSGYVPAWMLGLNQWNYGE